MTANKLLFKKTQVLEPADWGNGAGIAAALNEVDALGWRWSLWSFSVGVITGTSLDAIIQGATTTGGSFASITGASITQLLGASDDDSIVSILIDNQKQRRFLKPLITSTSLTVNLFGISCFLFEPSDTAYVPAAEHDAVIVA